ncbi:glucose-6-phosphate isomerase [Nitzschia inconspicua]|uniref:Glucose-6-phosphate isomerase n=1 Tax=Nitzschia inconspicua TaxID=303405 RepID=A0A9K3LE16_9STRA|nr:glucose-6-phosphate isomerase [Nitzschia inconspicua]
MTAFSTSSSSSIPCSTSAQQAWAILHRHARDDIQPLRLQELCRDNDRVSSLVSVYNSNSTSEGEENASRMLMVDLSRQLLTLETMNHLLRLASARQVPKFIRQLAWGWNDPDHPVVPARLRGKSETMTSSDAETAAFYKKNSFGNTSSKRYQSTHSKLTVEPVCHIPSYHLALRAPSGQGLEMLDRNGNNVLTAIHSDWDRIRRISDAIRMGKLAGVTGSMIQDVVVVGRGTAVMALRFVYLALCKDQVATIGRRVGMDRTQRRIKFLTSVDPVRAAACVADSNPASTVVISLALVAADEEDTNNMATQTLQNWLLTNLGGHGRRTENILSKHMLFVTANEDVAAKHKPESTFLLPTHSRREPFTTFTAAGLLPLSIVFGWPIVEAFLAGAHDLDSHFVETNPRHNLPVLLALTDIWNDCLATCDDNRNNSYKSTTLTSGRIVTPFTEAFAAYPAFVAEMEAQTCGRKSTNPMLSQTCSSTVIDGGLHGVYDRSLYQSSTVIPSELVMTLDSQLAVNADPKSSSQGGGGSMQKVYQAQDALICSLFAHADGLAFGSMDYTNIATFQIGETSPRSDLGMAAPYHLFADDGRRESYTGNRPSTLLLCGKLDAFTCGQLVAMAEHRAVVKAWVCEIDPFPRDVGTSLRTKRTEILRHRLENMLVQGNDDEDDDGVSDMNLSTKTILQHYANMFRHERVYTAHPGR